MPMTPKGRKIKRVMNKFYGLKKAKEVFTAMIAEGKLTEVIQEKKK